MEQTRGGGGYREINKQNDRWMKKVKSKQKTKDKGSFSRLQAYWIYVANTNNFIDHSTQWVRASITHDSFPFLENVPFSQFMIDRYRSTGQIVHIRHYAKLVHDYRAGRPACQPMFYRVSRDTTMRHKYYSQVGIRSRRKDALTMAGRQVLRFCVKT